MRLDPNDLSPQHLFDVLDAVAVRRTRSFVKKHYANDTVHVDGAPQQIVFPTPRVRRVTYDMDSVLPGFFDRLAAAIDPDANPEADPAVPTLARCVPSSYELGRDDPESYEMRRAGLLRSSLLKRFESSPWAFANTCEAMARHEGIDNADERDRRKVPVFSYFADTVDWIVEFLEDAVIQDERLSCYRGRIASHAGGRGGVSSDPTIGFAPETAAPGLAQPDRYDILVTTDVLAEGVNLQQARHIINYDLPWNPMRLVQRHGRIDRIGSKHREVFIRCIFPDARLDDLLGLEERLNRKIAQAAASIGVGEVIPGQQRRLDRSISETRAEIERLRTGDAAIFERGGTALGTQSGEEFRAELRRALDDHDTADIVESLSWGTGSGMAADDPDAGFVFCALVGDDERPQFRFVAASGEVLDDTLRCLWLARPADGFVTPRILGESEETGAFGAWQTAQADIVERWNHFSDKANLEPPIAAADVHLVCWQALSVGTAS